MTIEEAARSLQTKPENLETWESGGDLPSMPQLRRMAKVYKRLLSDFYLPQPPESEPLPHDFRRLPGEVANVYTRELRYELRAAAERRRLALDLSEELDKDPPPVTGNISPSENPEIVGQKIREMLQVSFRQQDSWRESRTHYRNWRYRIEAFGVLVFQITGVRTEQMLGFSLAERPLPVIAINRKLKPNGRTFTMLHEFVHVLIGENSLCDIEEDALRLAQEQATEVFCNAVAAATLMPKGEFLAHDIVARHDSQRQQWDDYELSSLSRSFGASEEAVIRRLLTHGRTSREFYVAKRAALQARNQALNDQKEEGEIRQTCRARC